MPDPHPPFTIIPEVNEYRYPANVYNRNELDLSYDLPVKDKYYNVCSCGCDEDYVIANHNKQIIKKILADNADVNKPYLFLSRIKHSKYVTLPILACVDFSINSCLKKLIDAGANVNAYHIYPTYQYNEYLLDTAIESHNYDAVKLLLKRGAVPGRWEMRNTPSNFIYSNMCYGPINVCTLPITKLLFEYYYDKYRVNYGRELVLYNTSHRMDIELTQYLMAKGAHLKKYYYSYDEETNEYDISTLLIGALEYLFGNISEEQYNYIEFILELFNYDTDYINAINNDGKTALYYAFDMLQKVYAPKKYTKKQLKNKYESINEMALKLIRLLVSHGGNINVGTNIEYDCIKNHLGIFMEVIPTVVVNCNMKGYEIC